MQEGINKATAKLNNFKKTGDDAGNSMGKSVNQIQNKMKSLQSTLEKTQTKIADTKNELTTLYSKQNEIVDKYRSRPALSNLGNDDFNALVSEMDKEYVGINNKIMELEEKLQQLRNVSNETKESINTLKNSISSASSATQNASEKVKQATNNTRRLGKEISNTGERAKRSTSKIAGFANLIDRSFRRILRRIFIYNLIYKAIRGFIGYMGGALKTNNEFVRSLNTIKTNLRVAFQPIYEFILPAINALMRALATLTTYIANFTSAIFGKTYKQSYDAAKGIETAKKAMDGYGSSAKKAKGQLAGFDEINVLGKDDGSGGGSSGFEMEMPDLTEIDEGPITRLQKLLAELFEPFKLAWKNEGQATIESAKRAFNSIKALLGEVGKSFKEVWTGGSGQEILEKLLRILQQILNLIGSIANAFRNAWMENETGTKVIQRIADIFNIILGIVESIGQSLNNVWGEVGQEVANTFMAIMESTVDVLHTLAEALRQVWDNGGQHLFESLIRLGAKVFELAGYIYTEFVAPFVNWFIELMAPAIGVVMDWVADLLDKFTELIDWLMGDGKPVLDTIITVLGSLAIAFGVVKGAIIAKTTALAIGKGALGLFKGALLALTGTIGLVTIAIGAVIAIGVLLYKNWDEISAWLKETWEIIKDKAEEIWGNMADFFKESWENTKQKAEEIWNSIKDFLIQRIWEPIKNSAKTIWESVKKNILDPIQLAWEKLVEVWNKIKTFILKTWDDIRRGILDMKNNIIDAIMSPFNTAKEKIDKVVGEAKGWGRNLISNFTDGINSMREKAANAARSVANRVSDFLGFHSPSKDGPGKDADKWMPNLMNMLADGIEDNVYKVSGAVDVTAQALRGMDTSNSADMGATQSSNGGGDTTIVVKIGEDTILDKVISGVNRQNRISGETVITV